MLPEITILERVVEKLRTIRGQAPYSIDFGERVTLWDPTEIPGQGDTPCATVGYASIDPGTTDGAGILSVGIEIYVGPDFWEAAEVEPQHAILQATRDVRECLARQHPDLDGALYRGRNSAHQATRFFRPQQGDVRLAASVLWRYVFHDIPELNGP